MRSLWLGLLSLMISMAAIFAAEAQGVLRPVDLRGWRRPLLFRVCDFPKGPGGNKKVPSPRSYGQ